MSLEQSAGRLPRARRRGVKTPVAVNGVLTGVRSHWAVLVVLLLFAGAAVVVPTLTPVATTDDWAYARSAQILLAEGRLTIFPVVAATAVIQVVWGALFGLLFGPTLGIFRLSTVVITGLGAVALYGLCRDLGVSAGRGALGVAAYLANPLVFVLAFTFMTDAHFVALLLLATWLFIRSLPSVPLAALAPLAPFDPLPSPVTPRPPSPPERSDTPFSPSSISLDSRYLIAGSAVAGLAFLARQQGALIVPMVVLFLLVTRRMRFDRAGAATFLQVTAIPALTLVGYYLWLRFGNDVPQVQASFFREVLEEGWSGTWWLLRQLTVIELIYLGFFTLPLMAAALPFARQVGAGVSRLGWLLFAVWAAIAAIGVVIFWRDGARMPYIPQFFGAGGLGPPDVLGSRPRFITPEMRGILTVVCLGATLLLGLVFARAISCARSNPSPHGEKSPSPCAQAGYPRSGSRLGVRVLQGFGVRVASNARAGLVLSIALGQVIGVMPPSYHYIGWAAGSLDRYLLPLAPLAIALTLWALRGVRLALPLGWVLAAALALFSIAGTRDYLAFMQNVWTMGDRALAAGVPLERLDAGSAWDGYHLYERGLDEPIRSRTPRGGPWWVYFYAPATDSAYVVASKPLKWHVVVMQQSFDPWLGPPMTISLQRRWGAPWPARSFPREWAERLRPTKGIDGRAVIRPALVQETPAAEEAVDD